MVTHWAAIHFEHSYALRARGLATPIGLLADSRVRALCRCVVAPLLLAV